MNILVCGGSGFIGSYFVRHVMSSTEHRIWNVDKLTYASLPYVQEEFKRYDHDRYVHWRTDICNKKDLHVLFEQMKPDAVVNFAAETHVDRSIKHPDPFIRTNLNGLYNVLELSKKFEARFVQVSTDEVYGSGRASPYREYERMAPGNPYSATKAAGDMLTLSYFNTYGTDVLITRGSNTYGPGQYPEKLIPLAITKLMNGEKIPIYGSGRQRRQWLHASDHARGIYRVLTNGKTGEVYNVGASDDMANIEVIRFILKYFDADESRLEYVEDRPGHDFFYSINSDKLRKLRWKPKIRFDRGIKNTVNWYLERSDLFRSL